ncbi:hypothetical protein [Streptomyces atratus]|uniref:hypothetical protein n=1 Tax=Streptomyces atratus TaxID=1893 RepID=UPI0021A3B78C|nr:hypothetical protein [Streptomyces atratus]MCT2548183.1 hypothetical protein [Streptomyces atratus]
MASWAATGVVRQRPGTLGKVGNCQVGAVSMPFPTPHRGAGLDPTSYEAETERFARAGEWPAGWRPR